MTATSRNNDEWRELRFSEAVQVNPSVGLTRGEVYPFVGMASVDGGQRAANGVEHRVFKGSGSKFQNGDTLMARITPCLENGKIARYQPSGEQQQAHGSTEFIVLRGRTGTTIDDFAYYLTRWEEVRQYAIGQMTGTSGRQRVPVDSLDHLIVPIPPLQEQRTIAHILGTLDDKIELNRRMNETLEQMARAVFKSWFVDFEPVRAKMEAREPDLPPELWEIFPDGLTDSELGELPEGWAVKTLGEICEKPQYGYTASAQSDPVGPKFLRITDINKTPWIEWANVPFCIISDADLRKFMIRNGDVLIARMADPGHGVMVEEDLDAVFASYLIRFRPSNTDHGRLLQYWLKSASYWELVQSRGAGTTRISLNAKVLSEFPLVIPTDAVANRFAQLVHSIRRRIVANVAEIEALAAQRDALLPKLVSGELQAET